MQPARRILMLAACPFPSPQGSQVFIRHLATALSDAGHEVHLVCYGSGHTPLSAPLRFAVHRTPERLWRARSGALGGTPPKEAGFLPHIARSGPSWDKPLADAAFFAHAARLLRDRRFDLIHAHNVEGQAVGIALRALFGVPLVYHCHNAMAFELPTYFAGLTARVAAHLGRLMDAWLPRLADAVITFDARHAATHVALGTRACRVHVIPPGLAGNELRGAPPAAVRALRAQLGPGPLALYAGNPDAYQNLDLLWQAWALVRARQPAVQLLVASHHPAAAFGPARPGVQHVPICALASLKAVHALAHVAVCPRAAPTGAPIKVLNYLAAGLPVVACTPASSRLMPPSAGQLVEPSPDAFAQALLTELARPRRRVRLPQRLRLQGQMSAYAAAYLSAMNLFASGQQSLREEDEGAFSRALSAWRLYVSSSPSVGRNCSRMAPKKRSCVPLSSG